MYEVSGLYPLSNVGNIQKTIRFYSIKLVSSTVVVVLPERAKAQC